MEKKLFGHLPDGKPVHLYTLDNGKLRVSVLDWGCRIQSIIFDGTDLACGYDNLEAYLADGSSQGAFVGRVANRIKGGCFTLNGKTYQLEKNDGNNHLHGSFGYLLWEVERAEGDTLVLSHHSPAEEEGYPGDMDVTVTYRIVDAAVFMEYTAICTEDTPINLTNHTYFNAGGIGSGSVLTHTMQLNADHITLVDSELIPIGRTANVAGTAYDFRTPHPIGARFGEKIDGYDTNFWLTKTEPAVFCERELFRAGSVRSSSYAIDCYTDMPCMQVYTGNFLGSEPIFKYGVRPARQTALCLETQYEPDAVNHGTGILRAGDRFRHATVYRFSKL